MFVTGTLLQNLNVDPVGAFDDKSILAEAQTSLEGRYVHGAGHVIAVLGVEGASHVVLETQWSDSLRATVRAARVTVLCFLPMVGDVLDGMVETCQKGTGLLRIAIGGGVATVWVKADRDKETWVVEKDGEPVGMRFCREVADDDYSSLTDNGELGQEDKSVYRWERELVTAESTRVGTGRRHPFPFWATYARGWQAR